MSEERGAAQGQIDALNAGLNARAQGVSFLDNPYLGPENTPGEKVEERSAKASAWNDGWKMADTVVALGL